MVPPLPGWIKVNYKEVSFGLGWTAREHEARILEVGVKILKAQMSTEIGKAKALDGPSKYQVKEDRIR